MYFKAVEAILLVQCFYISIAATQMIPMIDNGGWILALIIPVPCILYILQMVLTKAVLLRAVYELNREVASLVTYPFTHTSTHPHIHTRMYPESYPHDSNLTLLESHTYYFK